MTKNCSKCGINKDYKYFYKDRRTSDGLYSCCKDCHHITLKIFQSSNKYKLNHKKYKNEYNKKRLSVNSNNKEVRLRYLCRLKTHYLIKIGLIIKTKCAKCNENKVEAHHNNYNKPEKVIFLCRKHHKELHKRRSKNKLI